ncbi:DUF11 domain-containing protein, partial [Acidobacteria bacterium AH-259-O06]|nr:DUF11 domain-containing protein [Acidobacteria bacterium AH-259-O06]
MELDKSGLLARFLAAGVRYLFRAPPLLATIIFCSSYLLASSTLNFPRLSFEEETLTGVAIVNPGDQDALVTITAYGENGQPLSGIVNPVQVTVPANQQFSKLTSELFGGGLDPATVAWFQATSPVDDLTGFFLFLNIPLPAILFDGADLPPSDKKIVFTQVRMGSGNTTELNIINPSSATANLQLQLIRVDFLPVTKALSLSAMGAVRLDVANFFEITEAPPSAYVTVTSNVDIAGFEFVNTPDGDLVGLNARSAAEQLTHLYFPQVALLGPFETILGVVNNSTQAVILTITAFKPDGSIYGTENLQNNPVTRSLDPGGSLAEDLESMFGFVGKELLDGWLQVESTSEAVTGSITYGTPETGSTATVTPTRVGQTRAIFSHIATVSGFFTGVAVLNAGQLAANVRILAITPSGEVLGSFGTVLQPRQRLSKLIHELIPDAAGQSGGLIWITSDLPVYLTSLFGSTNVLANVPPQAAPETYTPDAGLPVITVKPPLAIVQPNQSQSFQVEGTEEAVIWKVNDIEGGNETIGIISSAGLYTAPAQVPLPQVVTVSAEAGAQTAGASVDVLDKTELLTSDLILQSVAYLGTLEKIYTAELFVLGGAQNSFRLQSVSPAQPITNTEIFEVPAPGVPKVSLTTFANETISKMISFTASTGKEFLLLAGQDTGRIIRLDPTTLESVEVASGLNQPTSLVIDPNTGDLLVAEQDKVTLIPKAQLESDLVSAARTYAAGPGPQAVTLFPTARADGMAIDRCTANVYTSDTGAGVIREFVALTGELRVLVAGLQQPGQLLALYRNGFGCPKSFQLLVIERGANRLTLLTPRDNLVSPWISALQSTDISFLPGFTPFSSSSLILLTELVEGQQVQQTGSGYALRTVELLELYRDQPSNPVSKPPPPELPPPELITPIENAVIPQNDPNIDCPFDPTRGSGYQIFLDWTDSSAPSGIDGYELLVKNANSPELLVETFVKSSQFTRTNCNLAVIDKNLEGWRWRVRAKDALGNFSDYSTTGSFQFAPCRLADGTPCVSESDLLLTKTDSPDPVDPGGGLTYMLEVSNAGPTTATEVTLTDELPLRVTFLSARTSQGSCSELQGVVTCRLGNLQPGAAAIVTFDVLVKPLAAGTTLINSARVQAVQDDPNDFNNSAREETKVQKGEGVESDLFLIKRGSADLVRPGASLTYTLTVSNAGPSPATKVTLLDVLPPDVSFVEAKASQGRCLESSGDVICSLGSLDLGSSVTVLITVKVSASAVGTLLNLARVQAAESDPNDFNNTAQEETTVEGGIAPPSENDLSVTKRASTDLVRPGASLAYTLTVSNAGPGPATKVTLRDMLPAEATFDEAKASQGTCFLSSQELISAGEVICSLGVLDPGATLIVLINVNVSPSAALPLINLATVEAAEADPNTFNNSAEVKTIVEGDIAPPSQSDLSVTKRASTDLVRPGASMTYTLTVSNAGPSPATDVRLRDMLPAEVTFGGIKASQGKCFETDGEVICQLGGLEPDAGATVLINVSVSPSAAMPLINLASVEAAEADPNTSNNSAQVETTVEGGIAPAGSDLSLTKTDSIDPVTPGDSLIYRLTVKNAGPSTATKVMLSDDLPPDVSFVEAKASQGTCSKFSGVRVVNCSLGDLKSGATAIVSISVTVSPTPATTLVNLAHVSAAETDPNDFNNSAREETTVRDGIAPPAESDLSVTKTDSVDPVDPGARLTYTLRVSNAGPSTATEVTLHDSLPTGVTFVSASASQGSLVPFSTLTWNLGVLEPGAKAEVTILVTVNSAAAGTTLVNQAEVVAAEIDPNELNNSAQEQTTVQKVAVAPESDLSITKSDSPDPVDAGTRLTYTLKVSNAGPSTATEVTLSDDLPPEVTFVVVTSSQGSCSKSPAVGVVDCSLGDLKSGGAASVSIVVDVSPEAAGFTLVNRAEVGAAENDPNTSNNSVEEQTTVAG